MPAASASPFALPDDIIYLNAAASGPRLHAVNAAAHDAVDQSARSWAFDIEAWFDHIEALRALAADTLGTEPEGLAFVPAASYGIAVAARNLPLGADRTAVLLAGEYPSNRNAWMVAAERDGGTCIDAAPEAGEGWTDAVLRRIDDRTAVVCVPPVYWTDGAPLDLHAIARAARDRDAALVVDASQSLGALPFDFDGIAPDFVVSAGHKWLLGALGFGWLWAAPHWRAQGNPIEETWLAREYRESFGTASPEPLPPYRPGASRFDAGAFARPVDVAMATAAMQQLSDWTVPGIRDRLAALTGHLGERLSAHGMAALMPADHAAHMCTLRPPAERLDAVAAAVADAGIVCSRRGGGLRIAPHLNVDRAQLDRLVEVLRAVL